MSTKAQRHETILRHLEQRTTASVADLASELLCSPMTIRRDLAELELKGLVERSHGGASATRRVRLEFALYDRATLHRAEKAAIGRAAAQLVKEGERIILDTGTTTLAMARNLVGAEGISVVTTSLAVVSALLREPGVEVMLVGGTVRESSPDLYGPFVEENLSRLHADWAFVGCDGISTTGGLTTTDPRIARATGLMIAGSKRAVLLADSSKAAADSFIGFARIADLDYIVTDDRMPAEITDSARAAGVEVMAVQAHAEGRE